MLLLRNCKPFFLILFIFIFNNFGKVIATLRKEKKWTQEILAIKAKINKSYLGGLERGHKNISLKSIEKIAQALDVPISEICKKAELLSETS